MERVELPSFREALAVWARIGLLSFGGPAGQIALMHRESANIAALLLAAAALVAAFRFRAGLFPLLGGSALAGLALGLAGLA